MMQENTTYAKEFFILEAKKEDSDVWDIFGLRGQNGEISVIPFHTITSAREVAVRLLEDIEEVFEVRTVRCEVKERGKPVRRKENRIVV